MTYDWAKKQATAARLITKYGQVCVLSQAGVRSGPDWDPVIGEPVLTDVTAVDLNILQKPEAGYLVTEQTRKLFIAVPAAVVPKQDDTITIGGAVHKLQTVKPLAPGGVTLFYEADLET